MTLNKLIKKLKDMETIYGDAVVVALDENGQEKHVVSVSGFWGEQRKGECRDPHMIKMNIK